MTNFTIWSIDKKTENPSVEFLTHFAPPDLVWDKKVFIDCQYINQILIPYYENLFTDLYREYQYLEENTQDKDCPNFVFINVYQLIDETREVIIQQLQHLVYCMYYDEKYHSRKYWYYCTNE